MQVGESPLWIADKGSLYWTDILAKKVFRSAKGADWQTFDSEQAIGCFARSRDGSFIAATENGFAKMRLEKSHVVLETVEPCLADDPDSRMNDGRCDRQGRFWASSMSWRPSIDRLSGKLYRLDAEGTASPVVHDLIIPNGLAFSPDGKTMYLSDSHPAVSTVWAYEFDRDDGTPHCRRVFLEMGGSLGRPDGATVDEDGCYWVAATDAGRILRVTPTGDIDQVIEVPVPNPTMPCFGGTLLEELFITSARKQSVDDGDRYGPSPDGGIFHVATPYKGVPEDLYVGGT
ncbi:SMP-30/gluconolactonase/LRE family protein [uncultured Algimonas sp.]|uniref:SMP-30/gluconolactonase/LRE family protein n=1 Tax=uncultured Algimonas sp. TaxID=1547920 RepID=UPI0026025C77|nr:SMP-30/gluconolactonase/LRE family protein [uncultured Algimonas sp.]